MAGVYCECAGEDYAPDIQKKTSIQHDAFLLLDIVSICNSESALILQIISIRSVNRVPVLGLIGFMGGLQ
jgi:hypothetical protein